MTSIPLPNGCRCSKMSVYPANWKSAKASVKTDWYISYRFYDPGHSKPKQVQCRGMNDYKDLDKRQHATQVILDDELDLLTVRGFNPITRAYATPEVHQEESELYPEVPFIQGLRKAVELMKLSANDQADMKSVLKYFEMAAAAVKRDRIPLKDIKRKDIRLILNACERTKLQEKRIWTDNQFNHYRKYLSRVYNYLNDEEIVEYNPLEKIEKKSVTPKPRTVLSIDERKKIDAHLQAKVPAFHRYLHIFFHSGARSAELLRLKVSDVDLGRQIYRVLIKKRKKKVWVEKTIKDIALPFWQQLVDGCPAGQYVFSEGLVPGPRAISPKQIPRRWRRHVIKELTIDVPFYAAKHLHTTEVRDIMSENFTDEESLQQIADFNSHTTGAMVVGIYDVKQKERQHKKIKGIRNSFAG